MPIKNLVDDALGCHICRRSAQLPRDLGRSPQTAALHSVNLTSCIIDPSPIR